MNIRKQYLQALKEINDWVPVSDWAVKVCELFPDLLEKANEEAKNHANETTGLREIAARISAVIANGAYVNHIEIDTSERPRKVRYVSSEEHDTNLSNDIDEDIAPLKRSDIIKSAEQSMTNSEKYRVDEFEAIAKQIKRYFGLDFEMDHACALLNPAKPGKHHPDNFQLILKSHNAKKNNDNWKRFSLEEQIQYIESVIETQGIVASRLGIEITPGVLGSLLDRLKKVY
ncbi:MAG: HNH endonuclease [Candidatus Thiodiazotropha sp. (ex Troendleina suluensis)]|nr:HNH endonuclease [Candidatus Thiodiazotropha sp. (ex Troendleina suluensis)]MCU7866950.1 HNH endonuclease [Candidatus Thiodiazotropha sp. (ex Lucinoma borealis)]